MFPKPSLKNLTDPNFGRPKEKQNEFLQTLGIPHTDSFNYISEGGLTKAIKEIPPIEFKLTESHVKLIIEDACILPPSVPPSVIGVRKMEIYPTESRQRAGTYAGRLLVRIRWELDGCEQPVIEKEIGFVPVMVKSKLCHLSGMTPTQLIEHQEHEDEWGGYFIIKGNEKILRMLLMTRRNYPIALKRPSWKQRGTNFSDMGILVRCVTLDQTATNNVLHFVTDGSMKLMFSHRKTLYYAPVVLIMKCLVDVSDEFIYKSIIQGHEDDMYMKGCVLNMLRMLHDDGIHTHEAARNFVGKTFASKLPEVFSKSVDNVCDFILSKCICIHLNEYEDKFNLLAFMAQKLYHLASEKGVVEGVDGVMMQELLMGGHLYLQVLKEKIYMWLLLVKSLVQKKDKPNYRLTNDDLITVINKCKTVESSMENFLATGNLSSPSGLGLMQDKGLAVIAENINRMRYMGHFRAVHRGAFFTEMRTTEARQLLPDAWGFICPVHTPDGTPCGLLNHLSKSCQVTKVPDETLVLNIPGVLVDLGMQPLDGAAIIQNGNYYTVVLDGAVIGRIPVSFAEALVSKLRIIKIIGEEVPNTLEIVLVPIKNKGQFPGLFLFTGPARMMRPVINLSAQKVELIGTFEQVYLNISIRPEEFHKGLTTHHELSKTDFLSNLACLIPMPDCNQSPRNMYQCQMGKQTMGTPCLTWDVQADTKLYRLNTPASPLFRPAHYDDINLDDFPMGTNAIVAVISYTGYDMEDAMIINKSSLERGFAHGSILKSEFIELKTKNSYFGLDPNNPQLPLHLGEDGLPFPGARLQENQPYYCYYDFGQSTFVVGKYKSKEEAYVDNVRICSSLPNARDDVCGRACITIRIPRNPSVGDKFASRAGQKGICSRQWPVEDLPFTESGLVPDIVFNPHGFPSRMTIAMMIECMAGKSGAIHGLVHDATPFEFSEDDAAIDYFGKLLQTAGYNYYGTERMYSGINGCVMNANIFFGIVHYQRLRHMVSDKWQARSTGPMDVLTHQPVKGRKRGGGVRFGEMERDSLISHGASFLLQDRLFHCSDKSTSLICRTCGTLLGPLIVSSDRKADHILTQSARCRICQENSSVETVDIPYIFKYLVSQLAAVNINVKIEGS